MQDMGDYVTLQERLTQVDDPYIKVTLQHKID